MTKFVFFSTVHRNVCGLEKSKPMHCMTTTNGLAYSSPPSSIQSSDTFLPPTMSDLSLVLGTKERVFLAEIATHLRRKRTRKPSKYGAGTQRNNFEEETPGGWFGSSRRESKDRNNSSCGASETLPRHATVQQQDEVCTPETPARKG